MYQDATWHGARPHPRGLCVRWGPSSLPKKGAEPPPQKISAHVYCGKTAGWIKMTLRMGVGLGSGHIVLNGDPAPSSKGHNPPPDFRPMSVVPNGWMDEDAAWYGSRPRRRPHCTRRGPSSRERGTAPLSFRPMSIVATVAHLGYC